MKKLLLALMGIVMVAGCAMAQNYEKNLYGVRAGLNVSNMSIEGLSPMSRVGFHVDGVYQRLLMESRPLYLETGLHISQKGFKLRLLEEKQAINSLYFQVPVMVNYKFNIKDLVTLYPSAGFYYAFAVAGNNKDESEGVEENLALFGKNGSLKRSDFGMRLSGTAEWKRFVFSFGYEFGFINVCKEPVLGYVDDVEFEISPLNMKTGNFFLSLGYNF